MPIDLELESTLPLDCLTDTRLPRLGSPWIYPSPEPTSLHRLPPRSSFPLGLFGAQARFKLGNGLPGYEYLDCTERGPCTGKMGPVSQTKATRLQWRERDVSRDDCTGEGCLNVAKCTNNIPIPLGKETAERLC